MKSKRKQWIVTIAGLLVTVIVLVGAKANQIVSMVRAGDAFVPPPEAVTAAKVEAGEWEPTKAAIGSLVAVRGVVLGAELPGTVREVAFESGSSVKRSAVLVKLDTSNEEAQLAAALAEASLARLSQGRARRLRQGEANAQADLDAAEARAKQADATVANLRATIAKKTIRAPFDGRVAIRQVEVGQVVAPGTPIASLQSVSPIHADFWLPKEDGRLRPGMFANVEVVSSEKRPVLTIPATAVIFAPYGDSVFAIEEKKNEAGQTTTIARQKFVRTGERRGDVVAVISGLNVGETIVSSGAFKLRNGGAVAVNNALAPNAQLAPKATEE